MEMAELLGVGFGESSIVIIYFADARVLEM